MDDLGVVSLEKKQTDNGQLTINTSDDQQVQADTQFVTSVSQKAWSATKFLLNMPGKTIEEKQQERVKYEVSFLQTALNAICRLFTSEELSNMKCDGHHQVCTDGTNNICLDKDSDIALGNYVSDYIDKQLHFQALYGLEFDEVGAQNFENPEEIKNALEKKAAAKINLKAADDEASAMKKIIHETGANPNMVVLDRMISKLGGYISGSSGKKPRKRGKTDD
jgi:hypothetical protein